VVDRGGTRTLGGDEADLVPGVVGVLRKEITLVGRDERRTKEPIVVEVRLMPDAAVPDGKTCALATRLTTRRAAGAKSQEKTGAPKKPAAAKDDHLDLRETSLALGDAETRMIEAYASPVTGGRVAFRFECAPARPAHDAIPEFVTIDLQVEKSGEGESSEMLRNQRLVAALGREASTVVSANTTLPDGADGSKRYRRDRLEAILTPLVVTAGRLQLSVQVRGDATTMSSESAPSIAEFDRTESFLLAAGERRTFMIDVAAAGRDDGWTKITLRVDVVARF
ncbi:MAG TPA: hypothetical protein VJV75_07570, partial [Candidatus Polarisedimenticolia bacterium]|nr:hypothetical protein [Candidatus Polarisedimenticolia bacterium]